MSRSKRRNRESPVALFSFQDLITSLSGILILLVLLMAIEVATRAVVETVPQSPSQSESTAPLRDLQEEVAVLRSRLTEVQAVASNKLSRIIKSPSEVTAENRSLANTREALALKSSALEERLLDAKEEDSNSRAELQSAEATAQALKAKKASTKSKTRLALIPDSQATKTPVVVECSAMSARAGHLNDQSSAVTFNFNNDGLKRFAEYIGRISPTREYVVFMVKPSGVKWWRILRILSLRAGLDVGDDPLEEDYSIAFGSDA